MYWYIVFFSFLGFTSLCADQVRENVPKKKMLIFSSRGGYGHQKASEEFEEIFKDEYSVKIVYWLEDGPFKKYDIVRNLSFGFYSGESFYNFLLKKQWMSLLRMVVNNGPSWARSNRYGMEEAMFEYLLEERPDIIVSVAPIFNLPAIEAAQRLSVPYLLSTLDAELITWCEGLEKSTHPAYAITIAYDAVGTREYLEKIGIPSKNIYTIGMPVSQKLLKRPKDLSSLYKKWNVRPDVPCILIMMGGVGTLTAYEYAQALAKMNIAADVLVCAGKNTFLRKKVSQLLPVSKKMNIHALDFVDDIHELMFLSDFLITKGGGMTLYQAIAAQIPLVCHAIGEQLSWDMRNIDFIVDNKMGCAITAMNEFEGVIAQLMNNKGSCLHQYRQNMQKLYPIVFHDEIRRIVHHLQVKMASLPRKPLISKQIAPMQGLFDVSFEVPSWFDEMRNRVRGFLS